MTSALRVLITAPFDPAVAALLGNTHDVTVTSAAEDGGPIAERGLGDVLTHAQVIVAELDRVDQATLDAAPNLQLVVACRAKPANVDLAACAARGIDVATTPGRNAEVTADFTLALLLATVRNLSASERWLRSGMWSDADVFEPYAKFRGIGLRGRRLGVIGGGAVGRRVVTRALAFGLEPVVYDPYLTEGALGEDVRLAPLDEVLATSDIVTLHVPLTPDTEGLLGHRELALLRPDAFLINAGRAALIDAEALRETLRAGKIAGAGFDVFHHEPLDPEDDLLTFANVTLTPHIAGSSDDVIVEHSRMAADAIARHIASA